MVYKPCRSIWGQYTEAYGIWMTGEGLTHKYQLNQQVCFPERDADLAVGSLDNHHQFQHVVVKEGMVVTPPPDVAS